MTRCQHCKKLTHSEHMNVYFDIEDMDKIREFQELEQWRPALAYEAEDPNEIGKMKIGDIFLHFIAIGD
jgi:hypothetical protein